MTRPTYGVCDVCGVVGPFADYADVPDGMCLPCAVLIVAERSYDLAVLDLGGVPFVVALSVAEYAALN